MARICAEPGCGRIFKPTSKRQFRCAGCEPGHRSRANRKQYATRKARGRRTGTSAAYRRNRVIVLAGDPSCHWGCGRKATTADHLVPVVEGGTDELTNLVPACSPCNSSRTPHRGAKR
jgi:5-methylcytosine-specific restriction endonuclease McrA